MKKIGITAVMVVLAALCFAQNLPRVVLVPLENRAGEQYAYDVETIGELLENFINETQRLNVIDRSALDAAMAARGWRMDDWADNAKTAEMGRVLNAQYIVRGTVSRLGDNLLVSARVLDIATAELRSSTNTQLEHMNEAYSKMNSMAQILTYNMGLAVPQAQPTETAQPAAQAPSAVLVAGAATGTLEIHTVTAGTVEISGFGINHTVQMPAWSSLPPMTVNAGRHRVVMRYEDGEIEEKWINVEQSETTKLKFKYRPPERLNTLGASVSGTFMEGSLSWPDRILGFNGTIQGTYAPQNGGFFELGMDIGLGSIFLGGSDYFSLHLFIRYAYFLPFTTASAVGGGWYVGGGVGFFFNTYTLIWEEEVYDSNSDFYKYVTKERKATTTAFTVNMSTGFVFRSGFTLSIGGFIGLGSYKSESSSIDAVGCVKLAFGWSYRFKGKEQGANNK